MSDKTVRQLAEIVKIPLERLLEQLKEAGLSASTPDDLITEDEKMQLLAHLRKRHGKADANGGNSPRRVTLERRKVTEMKQASVPGSTTKTISVEVRKKKTYIKRPETEEVEVKKDQALQLVQLEVVAEPVVDLKDQQEGVVKKQTTVSVDLTTIEPLEPVKSIEAVDVSFQEVLVEDNENLEVDILPVVDDELEIEPVDLVVSEAKFEALKVKEEKKSKQEKSSKSKEVEDARKKQLEKEQRLEESIRKNADKVRQQAAAKQETLHRKNQEDGERSSGSFGRPGRGWVDEWRGNLRRIQSIPERF